MKRGSTPMRRAARPDGTLCSAQTTPPLPHRSISPPMRNAGGRSRAAMRDAPRYFTHASSRPPATRYRTDAIVNGGIVSTPQRIARYVEPHTTYTIARASQTREARAEVLDGCTNAD